MAEEYGTVTRDEVEIAAAVGIVEDRTLATHEAHVKAQVTQEGTEMRIDEALKRSGRTHVIAP